MEGLEAFLSGDVGRALELAHPDVTTFRAPPLPDPQTYEGRRGIVEAYLDWTADFENFQVTPEEVLGTGDVVLVEARQRATGKISGAPVEGRFWSVYKVEGGKVSRWEIFNSRQEALESAGIAPVSDESRTSHRSTGMNSAPIARKELVR
jgi:ketosteroid isomerase-like protein